MVAAEILDCTCQSMKFMFMKTAFWSVVFPDDSMQHPFFGCPVLEELSLENCSWSNVKFVSIQAPKLLKLIIDEDRYFLEIQMAVRL